MVTKVSRGYLSELRKKYKRARKPERIIVLDEFTKTTGYERQHAGKLLRGRYRYTVQIYSKENLQVP